MDLQREAIHQSGKFDLFVVEATDELAKLLLRIDYDPVLAATLYAEALHNGLQVEHFLYVTCNELANFVDNKHQGVARAPSLHQIIGTLRELPRRDIRLVLDGLYPRIGHRVCRRIEAVQDTARFTQGKCNFAFLGGPFLIKEAPVFSFEPFKPALFLQGDFQFGEIQVLCVAEALKKEPVHDLSEGLVTASYASVSRDIANNGVGWNFP